VSVRDWMKVGEVVRLTEHGWRMLRDEFTNRDTIPPIGSTAVITSVTTDVSPNPEYIVEFFAYPGLDWGTYYGEIERVT
jgi:hypothetical protein